MKNTVKFLCVLLSWLISLPTLAQQTAVNYNGLEYIVDSDTKTASVGSNTDASGDIIIPETITINGDSYEVTGIEYAAFYDARITSVVLPNSLRKIDDSAFAYCNQLSSISIPKSVEYIGYGIIAGCGKITEIVLEAGNQFFTTIEGVLFDKDITTLIQYPAGKPGTHYEIPATVKYIGSNALSYNNIVSVVIPDGVINIGSHAFSWSKITAVSIPNSVTTIEYSAFDSCFNLTLVNIGEDVAEIQESVFAYCSSLTSVIIPKNVRSIGDNAFGGCSNLYAIDVDMENQYYSSSDGILFNKNQSIIKQFPAGKPVNEYSIPNTVNTIGYGAFTGCSSLTSIIIPNSVKTIGEWSFYQCNGLKSIIIPKSVENIESYAFWYCKSLNSITLESYLPPVAGDNVFSSEIYSTAVLNIPYVAFNAYKTRNCWKEFANTATFYDPEKVIVDGLYYIIDKCTGTAEVTRSYESESEYEEHGNYRELTEIIIPESIRYNDNDYQVVSIGEDAFLGSHLTSVTISNTITEIKDGAFISCYSLGSIILSNSVKIIGDGAFNYCENLRSITSESVYPPKVGAYFISPQTYRKATLYVPKKAIDAYKEAEGWKNIIDIKQIQRIDTVVVDGLYYVIYEADRTAKVTYTTLDNNPSYPGFSNISVPEIINYQDVDYDVIGIGRYAFHSCIELESIEIPKSVTTIEDFAFIYCKNLNLISSFAQNPPNVGQNIFDSLKIYREATLKVPNESLELYKTARVWKNFNKIEALSIPDGIEVTEEESDEIEISCGAIIVRNSSKVHVYNMSGVIVYSGCAGRIELNPGTYIVSTDSLTKKVKI